jgi:Protein of unknown function (DUF3073)
MGRGRAKAKQTKVARDLKYSTHGIDLSALQADLTGVRPNAPTAAPSPAADDEPDLDDPYAKYVDDAEDTDETED